MAGQEQELSAWPGQYTQKKSFIFGTRWGCGEVGRNLGGWQTHIHTPTHLKCPFTRVSPRLLHILLIIGLSSFCAPSDLWFIRAALWHSGSCLCAAHSHAAAQSLCPASCRTKPAHPSLLRRGFYFTGHARFGPTGQGQQKACLMKTLNILVMVKTLINWTFIQIKRAGFVKRKDEPLRPIWPWNELSDRLWLIYARRNTHFSDRQNNHVTHWKTKYDMGNDRNIFCGFLPLEKCLTVKSW